MYKCMYVSISIYIPHLVVNHRFVAMLFTHTYTHTHADKYKTHTNEDEMCIPNTHTHTHTHIHIHTHTHTHEDGMRIQLNQRVGMHVGVFLRECACTDVLIRIDTKIKAKHMEKEKRNCASQKNNNAHSAPLSTAHRRACATPNLVQPHIHRHIQTHTVKDAYLFMYVWRGWVRECYGQVGRKVVCWCIDMLGEVRAYTHICVRVWGFARVGVNVYAYALRNTLSNTYVLTSNISTKKSKKPLWQYNDIETKVWCELY